VFCAKTLQTDKVAVTRIKEENMCTVEEQSRAVDELWQQNEAIIQ
jgi:hypothetical protein